MKVVAVFTETEKEKLQKFLDTDVCQDIDCSCIDGCENCPLQKVSELKDKINSEIRKVLTEI